MIWGVSEPDRIIDAICVHNQDKADPEVFRNEGAIHGSALGVGHDASQEAHITRELEKLLEKGQGQLIPPQAPMGSLGVSADQFWASWRYRIELADDQHIWLKSQQHSNEILMKSHENP